PLSRRERDGVRGVLQSQSKTQHPKLLLPPTASLLPTPSSFPHSAPIPPSLQPSVFNPQSQILPSASSRLRLSLPTPSPRSPARSKLPLAPGPSKNPGGSTI